MVYIITFESFEPCAVAIDQGSKPSGFDLHGALDHAARLIEEGKPNVTVSDGEGHSISGELLLACVRGERTLTEDLRAN